MPCLIHLQPYTERGIVLIFSLQWLEWHSHDTTIGYQSLTWMNPIRYRSRIEFDTPICGSPVCVYLYGSLERLQYEGNTHVVISPSALDSPGITVATGLGRHAHERVWRGMGPSTARR